MTRVLPVGPPWMRCAGPKKFQQEMAKGSAEKDGARFAQ